MYVCMFVIFIIDYLIISYLGIEEITKAVISMNSGKTVGPDDIVTRRSLEGSK
jgi:hypothetical protein